MDQARGLLSREVDLSDVARDDHLRAEPEPRQEHLHLLGSRVLRLVEDHEGVVQRPPAHEGERRHLDRAAVDVRVEAIGVHRVVERVEERPHVRVDLRQDVAGQEPEPLAGLDGGPGQDDPPDLPLGERLHGERDREVRLAGAGRADREGDRRGTNRVDVALLRHRLRRDLLAAVPPDDVVEHVADVGRLVERGDHRADRVGPDRMAALDELDKLVDDRSRLGDPWPRPRRASAVPAQRDRAAEPLAQRVEHAVGDAGELRRNLVRNGQHVLHAPQCRARRGVSRARLAWLCGERCRTRALRRGLPALSGDGRDARTARGDGCGDRLEIWRDVVARSRPSRPVCGVPRRRSGRAPLLRWHCRPTRARCAPARTPSGRGSHAASLASRGSPMSWSRGTAACCRASPACGEVRTISPTGSRSLDGRRPALPAGRPAPLTQWRSEGGGSGGTPWVPPRSRRASRARAG